MNKTKLSNRIISFLLVCLMVLTLLPSTVFAGNEGVANIITTPSSNGQGKGDGKFYRQGNPDGYRVSVYFARKYDEEVDSKGVISPKYAWPSEKSDAKKNIDYFKIGRSIDLRRTDLGANPSFWGAQDVFMYINEGAQFFPQTSGNYTWSKITNNQAPTERFDKFYKEVMNYKEKADELALIEYYSLRDYLNGITQLNQNNCALPDYISNSGNARNTEWVKGYFSHPLILEHLSYLTSTQGGATPWHYFNFIDGTYKKLSSNKNEYETIIGQYKIYIEPLYYACYGTNNYGCMTLREMIASKGKMAIDPYSAAVRRPWAVSRAMTLETTDKSLKFKGTNTYAGDLVGKALPGEYDWSGVSSQTSPNTPIGNYGGVGVLTSPSIAALGDGTKIIKTYVEVDDVSISSTGQKEVTLKEAATSDVSYATPQEDGTVSVSFSGEKDNMVYVLNDILVTSRDITNKGDIGDIKDLHWETLVPRTSNNALSLSQTEISSYMFNRVLGDETAVKAAINCYATRTSLSDSGLPEETLKAVQQQMGVSFNILDIVTKSKLNKIILGLTNGVLSNEWKGMVPSEYLSKDVTILVKEDEKAAMTSFGTNDLSHLPAGTQVFISEPIKSPTAIVVEKEKIPSTVIGSVEGSVVEGGVDNDAKISDDSNDSSTVSNKQSFREFSSEGLEKAKTDSVLAEDEILEASNKYATAGTSSGINTSKYQVVYVRYLVSKEPRQINIVTTKENGVPVGTPNIFSNKLGKNLDEDTILVDIRNGKYEKAELINWYTNNKYDTEVIPSSDGVKEGTTLDPIKDLPETENVYVYWEIDKSDVQPASANYDVPQWRLSRYWGEILEGAGPTGMTLKGIRRSGHGCCDATASLSPDGNWEYMLVNPNGKLVTNTSDDNTPASMKVESWLHSKALTTYDTDSISLDDADTDVDIKGNLNAIKSTDTSSLVVANWLDKGSVAGLVSYDILSGSLPNTKKIGNEYTLNKLLNYRTKNVKEYTNTWYTCNCDDDEEDGHTHGHISHNQYYYPSMNPTNIDYTPYQIEPNITFMRYNQTNTDLKKLSVSPAVTSENGLTTLKYQDKTTLKVYPEYGMLFANDAGGESIKWMVGDQARLINPVVYQTLQYKVHVIPTSNGTSVATDTRAKTAANAISMSNLQVIYKGAGVNTTFNVQRDVNNNNQGILTVKTFALDIEDSVKSAWGDGTYNSQTQHNALTDAINAQGKATATEKLLIDSPAYSSLDYTGATKTQQTKDFKAISYNGKTVTTFTHELVIRGGAVIGVKLQSRTDNS